LKASIAVCRRAGAQIVPRPSSQRWASGIAVAAATTSAAAPTASPDPTTIGRCAAATSGIVATTARPNDRKARSLR
jgi:hypothetical protein